MTLYTAPQDFKSDEDFLSAQIPTIFLAGSIEMDTASQWQQKVIDALKDEDCIILNPRRKAWDSSWKQTIDNPKFKEQVLWEEDGVELADIVTIYLDPETKSPITLLELGLVVKEKEQEVIIYCPKEFYRKGNVDITAEKYGRKVYEDEDEFIAAVVQSIKNFNS